MTDEEINIAIAEACGFEADYSNDLNAMHQAELSHIVPMTTPCYCDTLQFIIFRDKGVADVNPEVFSAWLTHATARQRAEAFLKTLNLWK